MNNPGKTRSRLPELDALRGIAALMVVAFHLTMNFPAAAVTGVFKYGMAGVQLFFMISGFVIFMSIDKVRTGKDFIVSRFARLYPIYWVCVSLTFLLVIADTLRDLQPVTMQFLYRYLANLTMFQYYLNFRDMDGPYWSLIIELLFYVVIFSIYKLKLLRFTGHILFTIIITQLMLLLLRLYMPGNTVIEGMLDSEKYFPLLHHLPLFLAGIVFYRIFHGGGNLARYLVLAVCFATQVLEYPFLILRLFDVTQPQFIYLLAAYYTLFLLFTFRLLRFIVCGVTVFLGRISYALYLFHQFVAANFIIPFLTYKWHFPYWLSCVATLLLVIGIATVNTYFIDEPLRSRIKKVFTKERRDPLQG